MLPEWLECLLTPCPRPYRALGYLHELFGIRRRHRAWASAWEPHLERSRAVVRAAAAAARPTRRKAVVLGAGWLYDVPLPELAAGFREVILVDVVHPRAARRQARRWPNVRLLGADVTGTAEEVWRRARRGAELPRATPTLFCDDPEVDLVASVNLLSQLPCLPERYLLRAGVHSPDAIAAYARDVVLAHLDYLRRLPGVVALIADVEALTVSAAGRVVTRSSTLYGAELPWQGENWVWPLVPRRDTYPHHGAHLRVVGVIDVKEADRNQAGPAPTPPGSKT